MKKLALLLLILANFTFVHAQNSEKELIQNTEKAVKKINDTIEDEGWKAKGTVSLLLNQSSFNNWVAGGEDSFSGTLGINYDRGGNIMRDFIGLGVAMDLPLFNRNQRNIKIAKLELEKNKVEIEQFRIDIEREIDFLSERLSSLETSLKTTDIGFDGKLDVALERYVRNFQQRRLTIVEFIDFINNYMENKESILERRAKYLQYKEELMYLIGKDIVS